MISIPQLLLGACLSAAAPQQTELVSQGVGAVPANDHSRTAALSGNGKRAAFISSATNIVTGLAVTGEHLYLYDRDTGTTVPVDLDVTGNLGDGVILETDISHDGRFIAYTSSSDALAPGDTGGYFDVFYEDLSAGTRQVVSLTPAGRFANHDSRGATISANGRYVAFESRATNLVAIDLNGASDIFVRDLLLGVTERVTVDSSGVPANADSFSAAISADGRFVAFQSFADNLVPSDTNGQVDVFVRDRVAGTTELVSVAVGGGGGNSFSSQPRISADGRQVAFLSDASDLGPPDPGYIAAYVRDRHSGITRLASPPVSGGTLDDDIMDLDLSADGRFVAFSTEATNLVATAVSGDRNIYRRDLASGTTEWISRSNTGATNTRDSWKPVLASDGRQVLFTSSEPFLVPGDFNARDDVFVRDLEPGETADGVLAWSVASVAPGQSFTVTWAGAPAFAAFYLLASGSLNGTTVSGHPFDIGMPWRVLESRGPVSATNGKWTSPTVPVSVSGRTIYLEGAFVDPGGVIHDSNALELRIP